MELHMMRIADPDSGVSVEVDEAASYGEEGLDVTIEIPMELCGVHFRAHLSLHADPEGFTYWDGSERLPLPVRIAHRCAEAGCYTYHALPATAKIRKLSFLDEAAARADIKERKAVWRATSEFPTET